MSLPATFLTRNMHIPVLLLYFFSGAISLAYEVLWVRMLSLQFGVSIFGVVITVSAFMLGLGAGSLYFSKKLSLCSNPLRTYAWLELSIAAIAFVSPLFIRMLNYGLDAVAPSVISFFWHALQFISCAMLLFIPAFIMGAGFPLVLKTLRVQRISLGPVYGVNTLGAALGAITPLFLLPNLGWQASMIFVALLGLIVGACAYLISAKLTALPPDEELVYSAGTTNLTVTPLLVYAVIGASAIILEVGWSRLFGMMMLRTEYVVAIILFVYLVGIGFGGLLGKWLQHTLWFSVLPVLAGFSILVSLYLLPLLSTYIGYESDDGFLKTAINQVALLVSLTLPVTIILGAWLPKLNAQYGNSSEAGARLYGANSVGAALGGLLAGFVLLPLIGTTISIITAAVVLMAGGLYWSKQKAAWLSIPAVLVAAVPVLQLPGAHQLIPSLYADTVDLDFYEDAVNITHVVRRGDGHYMLLADLQRMDAATDVASVVSQKNQARLPLLLNPNANSVLFLGFGTGISASAALDYAVQERVAVEISQGAINAAKHWFGAVNNGISEQIELVRDDARFFLISETRAFDVIVGDLFHPDLVGRSALLSVEQFHRARRRLSDQGLFVQWIALNQFDVSSLQTVLRSFREVFPNGLLFVDGFRVALLGANSDKLILNDVYASYKTWDSNQQLRVTDGEGLWTWLGRYWATLESVPEGVLQSEWSPKIEFDLPRARYDGDLNMENVLAYLISIRDDENVAANILQVEEKYRDQFKQAYSANRKIYQAWFASISGNAKNYDALVKAAFAANSNDRWIGFALADAAIASLDMSGSSLEQKKSVLQKIVQFRPDHVEAWSRLRKIALQNGESQQAAEYTVRLQTLNPTIQLTP